MNTKNCERCDSKIVEQAYRRENEMVFFRSTDDETFETEDMCLCSTCLDEIWEFAFESDIDRSDKADPIPLAKMEKNVESHIERLEGVIDELNEVETGEKETPCRPLFPK